MLHCPHPLLPIPLMLRSYSPPPCWPRWWAHHARYTAQQPPRAANIGSMPVPIMLCCSTMSTDNTLYYTVPHEYWYSGPPATQEYWYYGTTDHLRHQSLDFGPLPCGPG